MGKPRLIALSAAIHRNRKTCYEMLERCNKRNEVTEWLEWLLGCLGRALDDAEKNIAAALRRAGFRDRLRQHELNARQSKVIDLLVEGFEGKLTSSKYAKIAKCSADTAVRDIRQLLDAGLLEKDEAGGRSTAYLLKENLTPIPE
ncbi:MAG: Fic family protein [Verrucomicrobiota bacterium]